jgi:DNA-binding GntR family transcriptional regulator
LTVDYPHWYCMRMPTSTLRVRDELHAAILSGSLKPGERLRAEALAQRFGTSRTPIREALLVLEAEGLVEVEPHRGAVVREFDADDLRELYELRAVIEPVAAARAARRIRAPALARLRELCDLAEAHEGDAAGAIESLISLNEEFHGVILEAAGSARLSQAMRAVGGIPRVFKTVFWRTEAQRAQSLFCHRELVSALDARHAALAEAVMRMHILGAQEFLGQVTHE